MAKNIATDITKLIGRTPMLSMSRIEADLKLKAHLWAKLEMFNPAGSAKDRVALAMIEDAERKHLIDKDSVIIEPTSGNTGIGLAYIAAVRGYKVIITMPDSMSMERRLLLTLYGAKLELTPAHKGMNGAIERAKELAQEIIDKAPQGKKTTAAYIPQQFKNNANSDIHYLTTAKEIWEDTDGEVDYFVAGIGTGGTITGVSHKLKELNPLIKVIGVEPATSAVLSGGRPGPHKLQGIGAGFIPDVLDTKSYDEIIAVGNKDAIDRMGYLAKKEGVLAGISSGAALQAAIELAQRPEAEGKNIVVLFPDTGERYLSVLPFLQR